MHARAGHHTLHCQAMRQTEWRGKSAVKKRARAKALVNIEDRLYEHLRVMIVGGRLLPGEHVVPEQLAQEMGVSRTPILSALKRLTQDSLFEWRARRGVFVRRLSPRELALVFEFARNAGGPRSAPRRDPDHGLRACGSARIV